MIARRASQKNPGALLEGQIVAAFGRRFEVDVGQGSALDCVTRGRRRDVACGDLVYVLPIAPGRGVIEQVSERASLLYRSDEHRQKLIAANAEQVVFVLAPRPAYSEELLSRCLIAADAAGVAALVVLNKSDLAEAESARDALAWVVRLDYPLLELSAKRDITPLKNHLAGRLSVLVGQSGMGKSTIINALVPGAGAKVSEASAAFDGGRHTTTSARLYRLDSDTGVIDSPGMQVFGLFHLSIVVLQHSMREFAPFLSRCRFHNCRHIGEPGCAVQAARETGEIRGSRLELYRRLVAENAKTAERRF